MMRFQCRLLLALLLSVVCTYGVAHAQEGEGGDPGVVTLSGDEYDEYRAPTKADRAPYNQ
jgi:hypothetical protein